MSFQLNNTSVYNILNSTGYPCTEDTYTTYFYFSKWIFTSQSQVLMFLHALHMNTPYLPTLRFNTVKYEGHKWLMVWGSGRPSACC